MHQSLVFGERRGLVKAQPTQGTLVGGVFVAAGTPATSTAASPVTTPAAASASTTRSRTAITWPSHRP